MVGGCMGYIAFEHTRIVASEGGESMAEFQPDPFLTSLGLWGRPCSQ